MSQQLEDSLKCDEDTTKKINVQKPIIQETVITSDTPINIGQRKLNTANQRTLEYINSIKKNSNPEENQSTLPFVDEDSVPQLEAASEIISKPKIDKTSQKYRLAMVEKALSDVRSMRSFSTVSTIAPDVITSKVKKNLNYKQKQIERKHCVAKGEASAATRVKRENKDTIKQSKGIWGWDE